MTTQFKIYFKEGFKGKGDKVVLNGKFSQYKTYDDLRIAIIKSASKGNTISTLAKNDKFILEFVKDENKIPGLDFIFNSDTFQYFLGLLTLHPIPSNRVRLLIEKVKEFPKFKLPQYKEILEKSLVDSWNIAKKELSKIEDVELKYAMKKFVKSKKEEEKKEEEYSELHINVVCNNCLTANFNGKRFICCECNNYNLCENCFKSHKIKHEHTMIKINKPIFDDINKFNNVFEPKEFYFKNKHESFQIKVDVVNIGENNLQCCFILPIRYKKSNLGCLKKTITDELKSGNKKSVSLMIKLNENDNMDYESKKIYEGYYRMFTEDGIPFGDIIYVKVVNDE